MRKQLDEPKLDSKTDCNIDKHRTLTRDEVEPDDYGENGKKYGYKNFMHSVLSKYLTVQIGDPCD